ncbi:MAG: beta-galactosidase [Chloroflexi bacterium]|nr:beta-galactosidase [Chloroflexota bacterium]
MHRTFRTSQKREQVDLAGVWDFVQDPQDRGLLEEWYGGAFPSDPIRLWVPGVWNTHRTLLNYEGIGWYRCRFDLAPCRAARLCFASVMHQANVWLDGEPVGEHYGGYSPFSILIIAPRQGAHELVVRVDSTHDGSSTIPSDRLDWFRYGGIPRPVWIELLQGEAYVDSFRVAPVLNDGQAALNVRAELVSLSEETRRVAWELFLDDMPIRSGETAVERGASEIVMFGQSLDGVEIWSPENPRLYQVRLELQQDDVIERTGFREVAVTGEELLLNGAPLRIRGLNRHEDHAEWGPAIPEHLMLRDLQLLKDMGANAIRGAHYPNDQRFLDLCDELGILFLEEIPLWGFRADQLASDVISDRAAAMVWAMVERDVSHPCIWAWSVLNECATDTGVGRAIVSRLVDTVHEIDRTRPVTFASDRAARDRCFDLVDFVCLNAYHGWYTHDQSWPEFLDRMRAVIGAKPMIVTEFGAGAIYGWHALEDGVVWSEEYQAKVLADCLRHFLARPDLCGFFIWQFYDTRTDKGQDGARALARPRNYNNKGLLNEYRQPKLAYYLTRDLLSQFKR